MATPGVVAAGKGGQFRLGSAVMGNKPKDDSSLTGDHLLGVVRLHVAVVLPASLRLPLLPGLLGVERVSIVLQNDDLDEDTRFKDIALISRTFDVLPPLTFESRFWLVFRF